MMVKLVASLFLVLVILGCSRAQGNVGDTCDVESECTAEGTICKEGTCDCRDRFWLYESAEPKSCIPALGNNCNDVHEQCANIPYSLCQKGLLSSICECIDDYEPAFDPSISESSYTFCAAPKIRDNCLEAEQCMNLPDSECVLGRCTCKLGFVPNDDPTLGCIEAKTVIGDDCTSTEQCQAFDENSVCNAAKCECAEYFVPDGLMVKCLSVARKIGDQCSTTNQCTQKLGDKAQCTFSGECTCKTGNVVDIYGITCLESSSLGAVCVQNQQCTEGNEGAECLKFKCACNETIYEVVENKCFKLPQLIGDKCTSQSQCDKFGESVCDENKTCKCSDGFIPNADLKKCLIGAYTVGSPCSDNAQCKPISNSACDVLTQKCSCLTGFVPSANKTNCLPKSSGIYGPCTDPGQCTAAVGGQVDCINNICDCKSNCHFLDNTCWDSQRLDETCNDSRECRLAENSDRAQCKQNVCTCKEGFLSDSISNKCNSGNVITGSILICMLLYVSLQKLA